MDIPIFYKDPDLLVCIKPVGVESEGAGLPRLLGEQMVRRGEKDEVYPVHRLDTAVGGVMVFARTKAAAGKLSALIAQRQMVKEYIAVVRGRPESPEGVLRDLLFKDSRKNKSFVVKRMRKGVKEAELSYRVLQTASHKEVPCSLVHITLATGRSHQIRVQFASRKMPLFGDGKYGSVVNGNIALFSCRLCFPHPATGQAMEFTAPAPEGFPWDLFEG